MPSLALHDRMQPFADTGIETAQMECGDMLAVAVKWPAGFDGASVLPTSPDSYCPVPHWGYVIAGTVGVRYEDGHEELAHAGEVFYLPPGHVPFTNDGAKAVEFSPAKAMAEMMNKFLAAQPAP